MLKQKMSVSKVVIAMLGLFLVMTATAETEEDLPTKVAQLEAKLKGLTQRILQCEKLTEPHPEEKELTQHLLHENGQHIKYEEYRVTELERQMELLQRHVQLLNVTNIQSESKYMFKRYGRHEILTPSRRQSRSTVPDDVAFTAELSHELTDVPIHTTIKFDRVITFTSNYYENSTGVFTCPTSGLYLFAVFIETNSLDIEALVSLRRDGISYMSVISERSDRDEDDTGGNVVLLSLKRGQRVWVETHGHDNQSFWPDFTTFSGVLIYRYLH